MLRSQTRGNADFKVVFVTSDNELATNPQVRAQAEKDHTES